MSREAGLTTNYDRSKLIILAGTFGTTLILLGIFTYLFTSTNYRTETENERKHENATQTDPIEEITIVPTAEVLNLPTPLPNPTLTKEQQQELISGIKQLNVPPEGLKEIEDYFNSQK
ncbi:hypothetical protein HGA91_04290 [candidate division WWE3 bacterium]|nr:hypothetical protein [candidate division WWE3 bacterium]